MEICQEITQDSVVGREQTRNKSLGQDTDMAGLMDFFDKQRKNGLCSFEPDFKKAKNKSEAFHSPKFSSQAPKEITERAARILAGSVFDPNFKNISGNAFKLFAQMLLYDQGSGVWASQENLGKQIGITENTARSCILELKRENWIESGPIGNGMRGKKHQILLKEQEQFSVLLNPEDWQPKKIPQGSYVFNKPGRSNLQFYTKSNIHFPSIELVRTILEEDSRNCYDTLSKVIRGLEGLPARLLGLMLALALGDPWNFPWYSKKLADWEPFDAQAYERILKNILDVHSVLHRGSIVINHSSRFKKSFTQYRNIFAKDFKSNGTSSIRYIGKYDDVAHSIFEFSGMICGSDTRRFCTADSSLCSHSRFRFDESPGSGYLSAQEWLETNKNLVMTKEEMNRLWGFILGVFVPLLIQTAQARMNHLIF